MKFAINVPNFGPYADARLTASLAREAEQRGWDGFHVWDHIHGEGQTGAPTADPWILLAAVALATERIRIGTMVTPVARRRPWKLARETVTLDRLSDGRLTLGVGLGYPADLEFTALGEEADDRVRAEKLDEGLDLLAALWSGESISHHGRHYRLSDVQFLPQPVQQPRIPIWVARISGQAPLRRAARWDGVFPLDPVELFPTPEAVRRVIADVRGYRDPAAGPFDVLVPLMLIGDATEDAARVAAYDDAGVTWGHVGAPGVEELRARIAAGPPR